jgi:hypothetical protein
MSLLPSHRRIHQPKDRRVDVVKSLLCAGIQCGESVRLDEYLWPDDSHYTLADDTEWSLARPW